MEEQPLVRDEGFRSSLSRLPNVVARHPHLAGFLWLASVLLVAKLLGLLDWETWEGIPWQELLQAL